jgi:glycosyltransferase involved in cell wall biosynthesis
MTGLHIGADGQDQAGSIAQPMARERVRVLLVIHKLGEQGGAERFTLGLAANLPRDRIEPWVCVTRSATDGALRTLNEAGVPCVVLGRRTRWDSHRMLDLVRLLRRERFDVVHSHMFGSNVWGCVAGRLTGVPVLLAHEHGSPFAGNPTRSWIIGNVMGRLATRFVAVSPPDARRMIDEEGVPAEKVVVMPTAYIPSRAESGDLRTELELDPQAPLVATVAVIRREKALDLLLAAFALLLEGLPDAHLVIAGDSVMRADGTRDPLRQTLEVQARELGIAAHVHFLGLRSDVDAILTAADAAVLCSDSEGMPLFVFECMANRTPLVATAVGAVPDVLQDGVSGVFIPRRDPRALAQALAELLTDQDRREAISAAASESLTEFTIDHVAARFADLYEELVSTEARQPRRRDLATVRPGSS